MQLRVEIRSGRQNTFKTNGNRTWHQRVPNKRFLALTRSPGPGNIKTIQTGRKGRRKQAVFLYQDLLNSRSQPQWQAKL